MRRPFKLMTMLAGAALAFGGAAFAAGGGKKDPQTSMQEQTEEGTGGAGYHKSQMSKGSFEIQGTLTEQSGRELTISRQDLPPVQLRVQDDTSLNFPGMDVTAQNLSELPMGTEVRARFQIDGDDIVALSMERVGGAAVPETPQQQQQQQPQEKP